MGCSCSLKHWDPICASNGLTYASPCLAGCQTSTGVGKEMVSYSYFYRNVACCSICFTHRLPWFYIFVVVVIYIVYNISIYLQWHICVDKLKRQMWKCFRDIYPCETNFGYTYYLFNYQKIQFTEAEKIITFRNVLAIFCGFKLYFNYFRGSHRLYTKI